MSVAATADSIVVAGCPYVAGMTTTGIRPYCCPLCLARSQHERLLSSNRLGSPDLDLRPPGMIRDTINLWLIECPECGYVSTGEDSVPDPGSPDFQQFMQRHGPFVDIEFLETPTVMEVRFHSPLPPAAKRFMLRSLIDEEVGRIRIAASHALSAAWVCDDAFRDELATPCRLRCARLLRRLTQSEAAAEVTPPVRLVLIDALRRAGHFADANNEAETLLSLVSRHEHESGVVRFQMLLIDNGVRSRDTLEAAFR